MLDYLNTYILPSGAEIELYVHILYHIWCDFLLN